MRQWLGSDWNYAVQSGDDLGQRMDAALQEAWAAGSRQVLIIGTDCPDLQVAHLQQAVAALRTSDLVLGPAVDGGYYLVGLRAPRSELFENIAWGTDAVLRQTLDVARRLRLSVQQLAILPDVDEPEDLVVCRRIAPSWPDVLPEAAVGRLSIVIPTLNEERHLPATLGSLRGLENVEAIVADGGSEDDTVSIAREHGAAVVTSRPGRGRQMNSGAALASGETLLFLHADARPPRDVYQQIRTTLAPGVAAGAFHLGIDSPRRGLRWVERGANLRARLFQLPYGDQGLFLTAARFFAWGGFANLPLMEDVEFCRRLRRQDHIRLAPGQVTASARRWHQHGILKTTLLNQCYLTAYLLGVSPQRLARQYYARRPGQQ